MEVKVNQGRIEGHVNAGCLLFMSAAFSDRHKRDIMDSTLYTQLAATKKHSRFDAPEHWRQTWLAALNTFGWTLRHHESLSLPATDVTPGTVWDWINSYLPSFIPRELVFESERLTKRSISAHPGQPAVGMWGRQVSESSSPGDRLKVGLQFAVCGPTSGLCLIALSFKTSQRPSPDFLTDVLNPQALIGNIEITFYSVHLTELIYGQFREKISQALEGRRADLICPLLGGDDVEPM
jgi:hypothetical protein